MAVNGKKIREFRIKKGLGQVQLAMAVGVSQGMISGLEKSERDCRSDTLEKLAKELNVDVKDISGEEAIKISITRNLNGLTPKQLMLINEVINHLKGLA